MIIKRICILYQYYLGSLFRYFKRTLLGLLLGRSRFSRVETKFLKDAIIYPHEITLEFLNKILAAQNLPPVESFSLDSTNIDGGLCATLVRVKLNWNTNSITYANSVNLPSSLMMKFVGRDYKSLNWSAFLNLPREAHFYQMSMNNDQEEGIHNLSFVPKAYYANGSSLDGTYCVIMEDLSNNYAHLGKMLGNQCWGADPRFNLSDLEKFNVINDVFTSISSLHATHWRDYSLFSKYPWLKNVDHIQGQNQKDWVSAIESIVKLWKSTARPTLERLAKDPNSKLLHADLFIDTMEKYCEHSSWQLFQESYNISNPNTPFTFCHGDFHAGNIMYKTSTQIDHNHLPAFYLFDYPVVGVFDPFFEISQFIISNASIDLRRQYEDTLFDSYYNQLIKQIPIDQVKLYPRDYCMTRYVTGVEKWFQLFTLMTPSIPDHSIEFFHNQISTFIHDHSNIMDKVQPTFLTSYLLP
ncbi:hypothetical protein CYY_002371 [Polysphondylium violaceum]|uniref:CHK kinase-like domain-containing protein n=1 Tax=Polysphondylium violaceum TaxID=133409 RepID=A0A8J4PZ67_9MYCE|nr:hypothetical protein CYY_002371 [Polysphondylium violaceum]